MPEPCRPSAEAPNFAAAEQGPFDAAAAAAIVRGDCDVPNSVWVAAVALLSADLNDD